MTESAADLLTLARRKAATIATAESCTGGMLGARLTDPPGASDMFERGFLTYSNTAKVQMLGVDPATIAAEGAVSETVARQMAQGALSHSTARLAVSITGIAGPGGSERKPEGRVCFAIATADGAHAQTVEFGAIGRDKVRAASVDHAMGLLATALGAMPDA